jgi:hypothetical protein
MRPIGRLAPIRPPDEVFGTDSGRMMGDDGKGRREGSDPDGRKPLAVKAFDGDRGDAIAEKGAPRVGLEPTTNRLTAGGFRTIESWASHASTARSSSRVLPSWRKTRSPASFIVKVSAGILLTQNSGTDLLHEGLVLGEERCLSVLANACFPLSCSELTGLGHPALQPTQQRAKVRRIVVIKDGELVGGTPRR